MIEYQTMVEEYQRALKLGLKEFKDLTLKGKNTSPLVLDEILENGNAAAPQDVGLVEIPVERIVGTKSAGRISAFTAGFLPILEPETEFAQKWISLCRSHLSDEGIREPILCYEYLGYFYVQEGNKRVSVLKYFGAAKIPGIVKRILPKSLDDPRTRAYYEFLDFYKVSGMYNIQFRRPGDYAKLLAYLGKESGETWTAWEKRSFSSTYHYFQDAFTALGGDALDVLPEEALLLWLTVYTFQDLGKMTGTEIRKALEGLWEDVIAISQAPAVKTQAETEQEEQKKGLLTRLIAPAPDHLNVAFIYNRDVQTSNWTKNHDEGRQYLERTLGDKVTVRTYFHADTREQGTQIIDQAVEDGAQLVFTTTPQLSRPTLKAAVKYPKVRFLNCSMNVPYSSIRTYYSRIYEGKFITGAIAGAVTKNDRIGYVSAYPILGEAASINAFALGAQLTNPRAKIELRWTCLPGSPVQDLIKDGIRVISNRDVPAPDQKFLEFGDYGTYEVGENGSLTALGSACWLWGRFYEHVVRAILSGNWEQGKEPSRAVNYWWGMKDGVIDVKLSERLPAGLMTLANLLRSQLQSSAMNPFTRRIVAQDGTVKNDGSYTFTPEELLHMDWLCENVVGSIPEYEEVLPIAQTMVRELGIHRDSIPAEKEGSL